MAKSNHLRTYAVLFLAALAAAILAFIEAKPAEAAFPGKNGKIAFVSNRDVGGSEIYTMKPNGTGTTRITFPTGGNSDPAFSPDGTQIAFKSGSRTNYEISVMNSDGSGRTQLTDTPSAEQEPTWSPDGTKIAYVLSGEIWVMNADGSGTPTNLTNNSFTESQPAWSPNGDKIAFVNQDDQNIYVMDTDPNTNDATNITPNSPADCSPNCYQGNDDDPAWSPDGTKIAYVHGYGSPENPYAGGGKPNIWTMDPNGANKTNLSNNEFDSGVMPAWSPDGTRIAYVGVASGTTNSDIWMINANGTGQGVLQANAAQDISPDWQQDSIPPNTTITSGPAGTTNDTSPNFSFASSETGSTFRCSLDGAPFSACVSPKSYSGLTNGSHTFRVQAADVAGNFDPTPASRNFTVDTVAPTVVSVSPTSKVAPKANATATFSEAMRPSTLNTKTFKLVKKGTTASVPAKITYSAATMKATLNPDRKLKAGATYKATLTTGAKDMAGNPLAASKAWTFKVKK